VAPFAAAAAKEKHLLASKRGKKKQNIGLWSDADAVCSTASKTAGTFSGDFFSVLCTQAIREALRRTRLEEKQWQGSMAKQTEMLAESRQQVHDPFQHCRFTEKY